MLTEDYLMRQIRLFVAALAKALGFKALELYSDALWVINQALEQLFGLQVDVIDRMDDDSLIAATRNQDHSDLSRLRMAAELYQEAGEIHLALGQPREGIWRLVRALNLYLEVELSGGVDGFTPAAQKIPLLLSTLGFENLPEALDYPLFGWAYQANQPWLGVKPLLRLLNAFPGQPELVEEGRSFLLALEDSDPIPIDGQDRQQDLAALRRLLH